MYHVEYDLADGETVEFTTAGSTRLEYVESHYVQVSGTVDFSLKMRGQDTFYLVGTFTDQAAIVDFSGVQSIQLAATGATKVTIDGR